MPDINASPRQIKLAVALSGGASLAVWMGGVVTELQRLVNGDNAYGRLARLADVSVDIDIIAGTSAGGINGTILAQSLAHCGDSKAVRDLWVDNASFSKLLRQPGDPGVRISLFRGDEYFTPRLREAFAALTRPVGRRLSGDLDLILTATLLDGSAAQLADDFGTVFVDTLHRAHFRFRRSVADEVDDFSGAESLERLALAARATSSYPGAFAPTLIPGPTAGLDMSGHVDFEIPTYVVDGGVLVGKPMGDALDLVFADPHPYEDRVLAYVQPLPDHAVRFGVAEPPTMGRVVTAGWLNLPHAESLAGQVERLKGTGVRLLHISADSPWGIGAGISAEEKLAGVQLHHFGAFYKGAWRANDWTWGRLDAVARIVAFLLEPVQLSSALQASQRSTDELLAEFQALCATTRTSVVEWDERSARAEIETLRHGIQERPSSLIAAVTAALQRDLLSGELPQLVQQIHRDAHHGYSILAPSAGLLEGLRDPAADPAKVFASSGLGTERISDDRTSRSYSAVISGLADMGLTLVRRQQRPDSPSNPRPGEVSSWRMWRVHPLALAISHSFRTSAGSLRVSLGLAIIALVLVWGSWVTRFTEVLTLIFAGVFALTTAVTMSLLVRSLRWTVIAAGITGSFCALLLGNPWAWRLAVTALLLMDLLIAWSLTRRQRRYHVNNRE